MAYSRVIMTAQKWSYFCMKGKESEKKKKRSGILIVYGELNFLRSGGGGKEAKAIDLWVAFVLVEFKEERVQFEAALCWVFFFFFLFLKKEIL